MGGWSSDDEPLTEAAQRAAEGVARQLQRVLELIREAVTQPRSLRLTPALLCELNGLAMEGIVDDAGSFRGPGECTILGSRHVPPPAADLQRLVAEMCDYANAPGADPVMVAAYVLWRINWIHPFSDGNGRTARAAAYLVLSILFGKELPGETTLVELMAQRKRDYWHALEAADRSCASGAPDVSQMTELISELLAAQIGV